MKAAITITEDASKFIALLCQHHDEHVVGLHVKYEQHATLLEMVFKLDFIPASSPLASPDKARLEERLPVGPGSGAEGEGALMVVIDNSAFLKVLGASLTYNRDQAKLVFLDKDGEPLDPS